MAPENLKLHMVNMLESGLVLGFVGPRRDGEGNTTYSIRDVIKTQAATIVDCDKKVKAFAQHINNVDTRVISLLEEKQMHIKVVLDALAGEDEKLQKAIDGLQEAHVELQTNVHDLGATVNRFVEDNRTEMHARTILAAETTRITAVMDNCKILNDQFIAMSKKGDELACKTEKLSDWMLEDVATIDAIKAHVKELTDRNEELTQRVANLEERA